MTTGSDRQGSDTENLLRCQFSNTKANKAVWLVLNIRIGCLSFPILISIWHGTVVERRSLAGELSLSCAQPVSDE